MFKRTARFQQGIKGTVGFYREHEEEAKAARETAKRLKAIKVARLAREKGARKAARKAHAKLLAEQQLLYEQAVAQTT